MILHELLFANRRSIPKDLNILMQSRKINFGERSLTAVLPLRFRSDGTSLLDWSITGSAGGVGKLGRNYLKNKTTPIPNGAAGSYLSRTNAFSDMDYAADGYTFNTGNATRAAVFLERVGELNLPKANVGDIMLVEGSNIPTTYDADTNLYKDDIMQGSFRSCAPESWTEGSQFLYSGDDGGGGTNNYGQAQSWNDTHCKTYSFLVKQNTDYSVRLFNSGYNDIVLMIILMTDSGSITQSYTNVGGKSIPGNGTFVTNDEQWGQLNYSHCQTREYRPQIPVDVRPVKYDYCESYAELKAGTYKLMADIWANNNMNDIFIGCQPYTGCAYDNYSGDSPDSPEWFTLIGEDNTAIIPRTYLFDDNNQEHRRKRIDSGAPYPNFYHKEYTFTLEKDMKVGLFHRAYYNSTVYSYPPYYRFMIVDSDTEAEQFATTGVSPANMSGYSAWEKYNVTLPVRITGGSSSQTVAVDLGESFLGAEDTISFADTHTFIPTYSGRNVITVDTDIQPSEMYIKYIG